MVSSVVGLWLLDLAGRRVVRFRMISRDSNLNTERKNADGVVVSFLEHEWRIDESVLRPWVAISRSKLFGKKLVLPMRDRSARDAICETTEVWRLINV